jgi:hypothetical protein
MLNQQRQPSAVIHVGMRQEDGGYRARFESKRASIRLIFVAGQTLPCAAIHEVVAGSMVEQRARTGHASKRAKEFDFHGALLSLGG